MTAPFLASRIGTAVWPHRYLLVSIAVLSFVALCIAIFVFLSLESAIYYSAAMGPLVVVPWAFICCVQWFGPNGRMLARTGHDGIFKRLLRSYSVLVLVIFLLLGIMWPVIAFLELRHAV